AGAPPAPAPGDRVAGDATPGCRLAGSLVGAGRSPLEPDRRGSSFDRIAKEPPVAGDGTQAGCAVRDRGGPARDVAGGGRWGQGGASDCPGGDRERSAGRAGGGRRTATRGIAGPR